MKATSGLILATLLLSCLGSLPALAKAGEVRLEARLTAPVEAGDVSGKARYRDRRDRGRRQFSVEVEGLNPGDRFDVMVAGQVVGTIVIDAFGLGDLNYDDNFEPGVDDPATQFPSNFPNLDGGEMISVGPLNGNLQSR